jgi:nucleoid DNA-binding protein
VSTKKEIVAAVAEKLEITQLDAKKIVQNVLDCIAETLVAERRIELRNFGVFEVKKRAARKARNPKTGAVAMVKERHVATFKAGKTLTEAIQEKKKKPKRKSKASSTETQNRGG